MPAPHALMREHILPHGSITIIPAFCPIIKSRFGPFCLPLREYSAYLEGSRGNRLSVLHGRIRKADDPDAAAGADLAVPSVSGGLADALQIVRPSPA